MKNDVFWDVTPWSQNFKQNYSTTIYLSKKVPAIEVGSQ
jgi:hypothetical protein